MSALLLMQSSRASMQAEYLQSQATRSWTAILSSIEYSFPTAW